MSEPIRVLQVIGSMNCAGAENLLMNIYRHTDRTKVQFDFLVCTKEKADFDDEIEALGGRIHRELEYINSKNILKYPSMSTRFFKTHNYKIVHCHIGSIAYFVLKSAKKYGAVTIAHSHATDYGLLYKLLTLPTPKVADYLFACSKEAGNDRYGEKNFSKQTSRIINNAICVEKFIFDAEKRLALRKEMSLENDFVIGHIGRFYDQKNHTFLIDIFKEILQKKKNAKLVLVGEGKLEDSIKQKVEESGISNSVIFTGLVDNPEEIMNVFDIMLFPSLFEGLPLSIVEAQANGLRCLLADTISPDTKLTDLVEFYSLDNSATEWASKVLSYGDYEHRTDTFKQIKDAGYDSSEQAKELEEFYLSL